MFVKSEHNKIIKNHMNIHYYSFKFIFKISFKTRKNRIRITITVEERKQEKKPRRLNPKDPPSRIKERRYLSNLERNLLIT